MDYSKRWLDARLALFAGKFPHTDVENLAHALMAASQQAAHAAALTATPTARQEGGNAPLPEAPVITSPPLPAIQHSAHASGTLGGTLGMYPQQEQGRGTSDQGFINSAQSGPHAGSGQAVSQGRAPSDIFSLRDADFAAEREVMSQQMPVKTTTAPSAAAEDFAFAPHISAADAEKASALVEPKTSWCRSVVRKMYRVKLWLR